MSIAAVLFTPSPPSISPLPTITPKFPTTYPLQLRLSSTNLRHNRPSPFLTFSSGGDGGDLNNNSGGGRGNDDNGKHGGGGGDENAGDKNRKEAMMVLAEAGRSTESPPKDLAAAIQAGRVPGSVIERFLGLEKSAVMRWLMQFGGFKERLLADDLFLAKAGMECGVGVFTKTAAEYERRRENFKELEIVFADVVMAIIADFMLVYLPAPTISLRPALAVSAGAISKFFYNCPDNAFQVALPGISYSLLQRLGAVVQMAQSFLQSAPLLRWLARLSRMP